MGDNKMLTPEIRSALETNDYKTFVIAFNAMVANRKTPTQSEFDTMVMKAKEMMANESKDDMHDMKKTVIESAIKANDYDAFLKALASKESAPENNAKEMNAMKAKKVPSKEEFAKMVNEYPKMQEIKAKHEAMKTAVMANDYTAFTKAFEAAKPVLPTEEDFKTMIEMYKKLEENKTSMKENRKEGDRQAVAKDKKRMKNNRRDIRREMK